MGEISFNYLVILICLIVNYTWLKDFARFDDSWFFRFRCRMEEQVAGFSSNSGNARWISLILIYAIPLLVLVGLLVLIDNRLFGLPTMLLHIVVLLIALDRTQPGKLVSDFLETWHTGDLDSCSAYMQQALGMPDSVDVKDECSLKNYFSNKFISRYLEKSFVMFFWYLLTGPLGVLFNYVSYQLRDSHGEIQAELSVNLISWVINVLEWVPIRLLGLTFSLAVNFVSCFDRLQASFWRFGLDSDSGEILLGFATGALTGSDQHFEEEDNTATLREQVTVEIEALQGLLERSQMIWLIILALITIFSLQN
ncbi:MAG: regulatory signaling modulator protein AmpE [Gammaproteobacteria bacterium]|nr:hypothetical protein [Gammaproteobacteria bacterium]MDP6097342.1 regulatory signaling modulator protein AmpE [Gammaproteobacteria bacterium]MDP7455849.1 regulatory signaling modulator protein AmpE [Gammaproteobacteria bacterium]